MTTATAGDDRSQRDWSGLAKKIRDWGREVGFDEIGIAGTTLDAEEASRALASARCTGASHALRETQESGDATWVTSANRRKAEQ